jgi:hypothetical protein
MVDLLWTRFPSKPLVRAASLTRVEIKKLCPEFEANTNRSQGEHMRKFFRTIITAVITIAALQTVTYSQLAPGIDWKRIRSTHFDIAVPAELVSKGQQTANMLEYLYKDYGTTLHTSLRRWTIKINPASAQFNGFVTTMPRYSEFYLPQLNSTTPLPYYTEDGLYELSIHEVRHIAQFDKDLSGFGLFWHFLGGDRVLEYMRALNGMPGWYYEGDATLFETEHSTAGRGRIPAFSLMTKARLLDGKPLTYYQTIHPSFVKIEAGDPYIAGYNLITAMNRKYGPDILGKIADDKNGFLGQLPLGFRTSVRRATHESILSIYRSMRDTMLVAYKHQVENLTITPAQPVVKPAKRDFVFTIGPQWVDDSTLMYKIVNQNKVSRIEKATISGTRSTVIKRLQMPAAFSLHDSTMVYAALRSSPRFENQYSDIFRFNISTRQYTRLSRNKRYYSPAFDTSGNHIASIFVDSIGRSGVQVMDAGSGTVLKSILIPELHVASNPVWDRDSAIFFIINGPRGYGIAKWNTDSSEYAMVLDYQSDMMAGLARYRNWLFYTSSCSGIDNIYTYDIRNGSRYQVSSRKYSASLPQISPDGKRIAFVDFTGPSGYGISVMKFDTSAWIPAGSVKPRIVRFYDTTTDIKPKYTLAQFSLIKQDTFPVSEYPLGKRLLNIHSWKLLADPFFFVDGSNLLGLGLSSNSIFREFGWKADADYQTGLDRASVGTYLTFGGLWPSLSVGGSFTRNNVFENSDPFSSYLSGIAGVSVPLFFYLNRSTVNTSTGIDVCPEIEINQSGAHIPGTGSLFTDYYTGAGWYSEAPMTNINGYYGVHGNINYSSGFTFNDDNNTYGQFTTMLDASLPAFLGRDNFSISAAYMLDGNLDSLQYSRYILAPRGIDSVSVARQRAAGTVCYSVPLWHPDFALGPVLYFNRIGMSLFGDATINLDDLAKSDFNSSRQAWCAGVALFTDVELFSLAYLPVRIGVHTEYARDELGNKNQTVGFVLSTPFPGFSIGKSRNQTDLPRTSSSGWRRTMNANWRAGW